MKVEGAYVSKLNTPQSDVLIQSIERKVAKELKVRYPIEEGVWTKRKICILGEKWPTPEGGGEAPQPPQSPTAEPSRHVCTLCFFV